MLAQGKNLISCIVVLIGVIVANVPEGILPATTVQLSLTAKRMASMNCLVKNLAAVETLGSTSVICSDKTGTLTQNRMTVSHIWVNTRVLDSDTTEDQSKGKMDLSSSTLLSIMRCATLCNKAIFKPNQERIPVMKREAQGDASESALLKFTEVNFGDTLERRDRSPKIAEIPFNSTNKYQLSIHEAADLGGSYLMVMKGAPERIVDRCTNIEVDGVVLPMSPEIVQKYHEAYETLGGMGERVLGFAEIKLPTDQFPKGFKFNVDEANFPLTNLTFLGLISLIDPPRAAVPAAVKTCQEAGVRVIMVTGDHPITAKSIARTVGIIRPENETIEEIAKRTGVPAEQIDPTTAQAAVVTGTMLKEMDDEDLDTVLRIHPDLVFARTSPQQKLIIVEGVQRAGKIVAVTGDGVNDSPALRKADIGIAMGITGSDVSKDAAKMILLDDNFASVVVGIEEGRLIFDNLRKTIVYLLTSNIPEIFPFLVSSLTGTPQAIGTATMLYIDLGTDIVPAIAISYEQPESDIMKRLPRNPKGDRIINSRMLHMCYGQIGWMQSMIAYITYFVIMAENGFFPGLIFGKIMDSGDWYNPNAYDVTDSYGQEWNYYQRHELELTVQGAFFMTVMLTQWVNVINCKCRRMSIIEKGMTNWKINFGIVFETVLTIFILYTPGLNSALQVRPLRASWWTVGLICNFLILGYDELRRALIRRYPRGFFYRETFY